MNNQRKIHIFILITFFILLLSSSILYYLHNKTTNNNKTMYKPNTDTPVMTNPLEYLESKNIAFFIATTGSDINSGTKEKPFATLEGARNAVRTLKNKKNLKLGTITVYLRGGTYYRTRSLTLESIDSGNKSSPIIYKAYNNEKVILTGGINLNKNRLVKVTDTKILNRIIDKSAKNHILQYSLRLNGIDYRNTSESITDVPELFFNGSPLTMARWPNDRYALTGKIINNNASKYTFQFDGARHLSWKNAKDAWLFGYWYHNWADYTVRMDSIDTKNRSISFSQNIYYGIKENQRYFVFNLLEELDKPGEWYLDRTNGILYLYPPLSMNKGTLCVSQLKEPFISTKDTSHIKFEGLTFQEGRNTGIVINGGRNTVIAGCTIKNISKNAVTINEGILNGVQSCSIYNTGTGGISIAAGDRNTLTAAQNYADNNDIYNYSRIKRTYTAAVNINGVGNRASHNRIHNAPHTAILFGGNDHIIEYNEIHSVAADTDDVGAIYTGRDWTFRGNKIRYNYIHHIENLMAKWGKVGIYLDDCMSSAEVYGNIFYKVNKPLTLGGGRDHIITNNLIINCKNSIRFDDRGLTWANLDSLFQNLEKVPVRSAVWKKRYPKLFAMVQDHLPGSPSGNIVTKNVLYMTIKPSIESSVIKYGTVAENVLFTKVPDFITNGNLDLNKVSKTSIPLSGFKPIPANKIGLYKDQYR